MKNWKRTLALLLASVTMIGIMAGCSAKEEPKQPEPTPAAAAPAPQVDKGTILKEAAVNYFNNLPANSNLISADDVKKKIDAKDTTIYGVDIRKAEDYAKSHVEGFVNIPFGAVGSKLDTLPKDKMIIVTCYSGQTAGQTVAVLRMAGFNAVSVKSGFPTLATAFGLN